MGTAELVIDVDTLVRSASGAITGEIFWKLDGTCFPEERWNDFPIRLLLAWAETIQSVHGDSDGRVSLIFMDGPLKIQIDYVSAGSADLVGLRNGSSVRQMARTKVPFSLLASEILRAGREVLKAKVPAKAVEDRDVKQLRQSLERLSKSPWCGGPAGLSL